LAKIVSGWYEKKCRDLLRERFAFLTVLRLRIGFPWREAWAQVRG
jgi:hypothetical protein